MDEKPIADVQAENAEQLDRVMNDILVNGEVVVIDGTATRTTPSAAMLNVIRSRVRDLGIQSPPHAGTAAGGLIETARKKGLSFNGRPVTGRVPPVNTIDDDAATARG